MIHPPERSPERDAAIHAALPYVPEMGWSRRALAKAGLAEDAPLLFPGGATEMVETYIDLVDRRMEQTVSTIPGFEAMRLPSRVRAVIALRFQQCREEKEAVRRAFGVLALPGHTRVTIDATARTIDAIWHASGDHAADFSWYTKRAILAAVYSSTVLVWLRDPTLDDEDTLAFLDRRLADVAAIGRVRKKLNNWRQAVIPKPIRHATQESAD